MKFRETFFYAFALAAVCLADTGYADAGAGSCAMAQEDALDSENAVVITYLNGFLDGSDLTDFEGSFFIERTVLTCWQDPELSITKAAEMVVEQIKAEQAE